MGKDTLAVVLIIFVVLVGLGGYIYFGGAGGTTASIKNAKVEIKNNENLELLLTDIGWYEVGTLTMLGGGTVYRNEISGIEVIYTERKQDYLQQGDSALNVFASVGAEIKASKLILSVHVDPSRLTEEADQNWWISHQVIRALNKMIAPSAAEEVLIERDRAIFDKYKGKIDLWQISF